MSEQEEKLTEEARVFVATHAGNIAQAGPEFQTLHMLAEHLLKRHDTLVQHKKILFDLIRDALKCSWIGRDRIAWEHRARLYLMSESPDSASGGAE